MKPIKLSITFLLAFLFIASLSLAQVSAIDIEQKPENYFPLINIKSTQGIKKRTIVTSYLSASRPADTILIELFDRNGEKTGIINFSKGERNSITNINMSKDNKLSTWKITYPSKSQISVNKSAYLGKNKMLWSENYEIVNGNAIDIKKTTFIYDKQGKLIRKKFTQKENIYRDESYSYKNGDMTVAAFKDISIGFIDQFHYSYENHLPIKLLQSFVQPNKSILYQSTTFTYKDRKLVSKKRVDTNPIKETTITYSYDKTGRVILIKGKRDDMYRNVNFNYQGNKLTSIIAEGNNLIYFTELLLVNPINRNRIKPVFHFRKEFRYNKAGNLIEAKDFFENVPERKIDYLLEYY